jgi:chromosome partitioning protein
MLNILLSRHKDVIEGKFVSKPNISFKTYAITNFRGGIGKSTLAFNLAWDLSRTHRTLLLDVCPQRNFTQSLLGETINGQQTIYDALLPKVMPGALEVKEDDLITSVPPHCPYFKKGQGTYLIPGSEELFLFPSLLYSALSNTSQVRGRKEEITRAILQGLEEIIRRVNVDLKCEKVIIDTSPFFGGGTHLAWVAAEALIIPVRVDQASLEALKLTLSMLRKPEMDFLRLNEMAGIDRIPKVHAIAMTHCGWNRQSKLTPDHSTQAFLSQVTTIANEHADLFTSDEITDCIYLLDDFHSAGRISGSERIPLARLEVGKQYSVEGKRLQVNPSLTRYQQELGALARAL